MASSIPHLGPYERIGLVRALAPPGQPPAGALVALARQATERRLSAGATLRAPEQPWPHVLVIVEGRVGVYRGQRLHYSAGPRDVVGMVELLARTEQDTEVRIETDVLALEVTASTLLAVMEDHFGMTLGLVRALSQSLLTAPAWLAQSAARQRLAIPAGPTDHRDLVDRITLLHASDVFAHARLDSVAEVAADYEEFRVQAGATLWHESDAAPWMLVLLEGRIECASQGGPAFAWRPGSVPGMIEAFAAAPRWHAATAATPVTGLRLDVDRFLDTLEDDFQMATDLLAALAARVLEMPDTRPPGPDTPG
ncbi:MAG: cyclic nucleotide-binding domain-containing protein [Vicinamibacterales bacterium]